MSIIIFVVILLVLILVHEYGHFIVAKKSGIRVDEFGIGFPPRALTIMKRGETAYTLNWLPFGGFVRIFGENPDEYSMHGPDSSRSFVNQPKYIQAAVLVAGVVMNVLFAWFLFWMMFMIGIPTVIDDSNRDQATDKRLLIAEVLPESPAGIAGLIRGDEIKRVLSGSFVADTLTPIVVSDFIATHHEEEIVLTYIRDETETTVNLLPQKGLIEEEPDRGVVGISMGLIGTVRHNPLSALLESTIFTYEITRMVAYGLGAFFAGLFTFTADFTQVAGPIGIVGLVGDAADAGLVSLLFFTAIISINLAIINILPIPALDGGRLLFLFIEVIKGSPLNQKVTNRVHYAFFILLILLILVISYNDVMRLFGV